MCAWKNNNKSICLVLDIMIIRGMINWYILSLETHIIIYYTFVVLKTRSFRGSVYSRDRTRAKVCRNSTRNIIIHFHFTRTILYQYNIICKIYLCAGRDCRMKKKWITILEHIDVENTVGFRRPRFRVCRVNLT